MTRKPEADILVLDDREMVRELITEALGRQPGMTAAGAGLSDPGAIERAFSTERDIVLLDVDRTADHAADAIRTMLSLQPAIRVIVMASGIGLAGISTLFASGALGFVDKKAAFREVLLAIRTVLQHRPYFSPLIGRQLLEPLAAVDRPLEVLSPRQREVLELIARGKRTGEIAYALNLSVRTVHLHRRNLAVKLGIESVADLTEYAIRKGLIPRAAPPALRGEEDAGLSGPSEP